MTNLTTLHISGKRQLLVCLVEYVHTAPPTSYILHVKISDPCLMGRVCSTTPRVCIRTWRMSSGYARYQKWQLKIVSSINYQSLEYNLVCIFDGDGSRNWQYDIWIWRTRYGMAGFVQGGRFLNLQLMTTDEAANKGVMPQRLHTISGREKTIPGMSCCRGTIRKCIDTWSWRARYQGLPTCTDIGRSSSAKPSIQFRKKRNLGIQKGLKVIL